MLSNADLESSIPQSAYPNAVLVAVMNMAEALLTKSSIEEKSALNFAVNESLKIGSCRTNASQILHRFH